MSRAQHTLLRFDRYSPDAGAYGADGLTVAQGVAWNSGMYQTIGKIEQVNGSAAGIVLVPGIRSFRSMGALNPTMAGTATTLYYFNGTANIVSLAGVAAVAATHWSWTRFGDSIIAADTANPIKVTTNLGATANLITSVLTPRVKYLATIKGHVFGAYADDGAAGAFNPNKFWWSARNNAADWQPGSNRAGFAEVRRDVGPITGVVGFEDFGVLFCDSGVYRIDYVGGDNVWALRQIASGGLGLPSAHQDSIAVTSTDIFYWSRGGPAAVIGGETANLLGSGVVNRQLTEVISELPAGPVYGAADPSDPIVVWAWETLFSAGGGSGAPTGAIFNFADGAWSRFTPPYGGTTGTIIGLAPAPDGDELYTLDSIDFVGYKATGGTNTATRKRFSDQGGQQAVTLRGRRWSPAAHQRSMVHALRPFVTAYGSTGTPASPGIDMTVTVEGTNDPHFMPANITTITVAANIDTPGLLDPSGYSVVNFPSEFQYYRTTLNMSALSYIRIGDLIGIDVVHEPGSSLL